MFRFKAANANTGASTLNVNALGAKAIQLRGRALTGGEIGAKHIVAVVFDGTQFQMISPVSAGGWELVHEQTPGGGVVQIDFTTGFTTAYDAWMFVLTDVLPDTDNRILHMQISDDGSTFEADATDYEYNVVVHRSGMAGITNIANS
ncbi:MAG: hypothetical protein FJX56_08840 [Alphaproteobacteria bacterium]|nr:hypothetical protein [Alphaproteobacteria bacterium]